MKYYHTTRSNTLLYGFGHMSIDLEESISLYILKMENVEKKGSIKLKTN